MTEQQFKALNSESYVIYKDEIRKVNALLFNRGKIGLYHFNMRNQTQYVSYKECET